MRHRTLLLAAIVLAAYWACLTFLFPLYFNPLVPHHSDMYIPVGLLNRSFGEVAQFPRPLANLFLQFTGLFGVQGSIAAVVLLVLSGLVAFVRSISGFTLAGTALFSLVLFGHPQFYFQHRHDVPAALSFALMLTAVYFAQRWMQLASRRALVLGCTAVLLMGLTKETYYVSALVLTAGLLWLEGNMHLRRCLIVLASFGVIEAACLAYNTARYKHYLGSALSSGAAYSPNLNPLSLATTLAIYVKELVSLPALLLLGVAFLVIGKDRLRLATLYVLAGIAALLPNSALPNHVEAHYAWAAAPLVFAPLLLLPGKRWIAAAFAIAGLWVYANQGVYHSEPQQWLVKQEIGNAKLLRSLPAINAQAGPTTLVSGLKLSYHPWLSDDFLQQYFGRKRHWVFVVPSDGPKLTSSHVQLADAAHVPKQVFDTAVLYGADGTLDNIVQRPPLSDDILIPTLKTQTVLGKGVEYLEWGWPDRALPHLHSALTADPSNPYPYFFLGRVAEALGDKEQAKRRYNEAITHDSKPGNPAFQNALSHLQQ